jgi:hypothetical protein
LLLTTVVRAYDETTRTTQGIVELNLQVRPIVLSTLFHVADIKYRCVISTYFIHTLILGVRLMYMGWVPHA